MTTATLPPADTATDTRSFTDLLALTLAAHRAVCVSCGPRGLELCEVGEHLTAASRPDLGWIRSPEGT